MDWSLWQWVLEQWYMGSTPIAGWLREWHKRHIEWGIDWQLRSESGGAAVSHWMSRRVRICCLRCECEVLTRGRINCSVTLHPVRQNLNCLRKYPIVLTQGAE